DRYVLERELGRGGMATVYLAHDRRHDRRVALKVLHPELAHALGPERFLREITLAARLEHPHILPVYDSGNTSGRLWFTMPYVAGESLRSRLAREPQLPLADALRITRAVADALGYAQRQGIIHRDVKPENILLQGERCVLADFGVARAVDAAGGERLTETGLALGTPAYMSPEQAAADSHLDPRSDIYSLGCVVYEMLAGEPPFTGRTAQALIARRLVDPVPDLCTVREVPRAVERAVRQALARAPADRFADAPDFARALEEGASAPQLNASGTTRHRLLAVAGALMIAAAATGLYLRLRPATQVTTNVNLLAVAPFDVLDPSLQLWREGLGDILSRTLDGAGPIRTVSPTVVHRRWSGRADEASALELSRRTGAGLVVYGAVVPQGRDSVTLRAAILDQGGGTAKSDVEVAGETTRIGELADSLGLKVLRVLSTSRPIGSVRHTSIGSRSVPALKAFLQGEQFYRRGQWDSALTRYDQAITADSTFALALSQMGSVLGWRPQTGGAYRPREEYLRRAALHNHGLPVRESLLIASDSLRLAALESADPDSFVHLLFGAQAAVEEVVRRYPDDPMAWYWLAEERHDAPWPIQTPPSTAMDAFARAIALDPGFGPAYEHVPELLLALGRPDEARRSAVTYLALDSTAPHREIRLAALLLDPSPGGRAEAERMLDTASVHTLYGAAINQQLASWPDTAETAIRMLRRLGEPGRGAGGGIPWIIDSLMWPRYLGRALAFRGHLREAFAVNERLLRHPSTSPFSWFLDPLLDLGLLGIVPDSLARATFDRAFEAKAVWGDFYTPRHLTGLPWWLSRGDTAALARFGTLAARTARTPGDPRAALRARLLSETSVAFLDLARGDSVAAIRKLSAIPDTFCLADDYAANCFHLNLTLARLLAARGDDRRAGELLERWRWQSRGTPVFVLATLELGRIAERLGDTRKAAECYGFVMAAWQRPDRELLSYVAEAREGLARLRME
ncbi:MAG TPA: protein kinase, partial [Gemmatimonadales bacterium]|nr:protein kinase [Gemmatimonadales bacterium]